MNKTELLHVILTSSLNNTVGGIMGFNRVKGDIYIWKGQKEV